MAIPHGPITNDKAEHMTEALEEASGLQYGAELNKAAHWGLWLLRDRAGVIGIIQQLLDDPKDVCVKGEMEKIYGSPCGCGRCKARVLIAAVKEEE